MSKYTKQDYLNVLAEVAEIVKIMPKGISPNGYVEAHVKALANSENSFLDGKEFLAMVEPFVAELQTCLSGNEAMSEYYAVKGILAAASDPLAAEIQVCEFNLGVIDTQTKILRQQKQELSQALEQLRTVLGIDVKALLAEIGSGIQDQPSTSDMLDKIKTSAKANEIGMRLAKVERAMIVDKMASLKKRRVAKARNNTATLRRTARSGR
ncbi:MAG: hypothetical protein JRN21_09365 [Nitrososphaerota archaeon]|nr:hypothetical protein [Nitrososphaerota archaeon]